MGNEESLLSDTEKLDRYVGKTINVVVSIDMGWSKRGNGKSYNSLNSYSTIIGFLTGKILDYITRNRKCARCTRGSPQDQHKNCQRNFDKSAKAMEADAAVQLVCHGTILKDAGLQVKVLIGDEDQCAIADINKGAAKSGVNKKVFKLADSNHVKKNFSKKLYKLKSTYKELNKAGLIKHIKKCFSYAITQNVGQPRKLANQLIAIPDHLFNITRTVVNGAALIMMMF